MYAVQALSEVIFLGQSSYLRQLAITGNFAQGMGHFASLSFKGLSDQVIHCWQVWTIFCRVQNVLCKHAGEFV